MSAPIVIAGFPGVGKSTFFRLAGNLNTHDSDSSKFDKSEFPSNYIAHIAKLFADPTNDFVFVSSHKVVRDALVKVGIPYTLMYPDVSLKEEFIDRYRRRGSPDAFITLLETNFEAWVKECDDMPSSPQVKKVKMSKKSGVLTVTDYINTLYKRPEYVYAEKEA